MPTQPHAPTQLGTINRGRVHLASADGTLFCDTTRFITHQLGALREGAGPGHETLLATLHHAMLSRALGLDQACARCVRRVKTHDQDATLRRAPTGDCADRAAEPTGPGGSSQRGLNTAPTGAQVMQLASYRMPTLPAATMLPSRHSGAEAQALSTENQQLLARCAQLEAEALQARHAADAAEGVRRAQAASLADLADRVDQMRCLAADLHNDVDFYLENASQQRRDGLLYVTERLMNTAREADAAARGYTGIKPTDIAAPNLPSLLSEHGWKPRPDRLMTDDILRRPSTRDRAWVRGWTRGTHTIALWFTSPVSLSYARCDTRGRLFEFHEIRHVITSTHAGADTPLAPPTSAQDHLWMDATIDQVDAFLSKNGFTMIEQQPVSLALPGDDARSTTSRKGRRLTWLKPGNSGHHDLRVYGSGRDDEPAVLWYWAGPIRSLAQLARLATR